MAYDPSSADSLKDATLRLEVINTLNLSDRHTEAAGRLLTEIPEEHRPGWPWCSCDFDELHNQAIIWYGDPEARAWAQQFVIDNIDASPGAIVVELHDCGQDD